MPLLFNSPRQQTTFYRNSISGEHLNSRELVESRELIGVEHGQITFRNWCFDGFRLASNVLGQDRETSYSIRNTIDAVKIYFNKRGRVGAQYEQLSKNFSIGSGQCNMLYSAELDSRMTHRDDSEMFSLQITPEGFRELIGEDGCACAGNGGVKSWGASGNLAVFAEKTAGKAAALFSPHWLPMNTAMERCMEDVANCPFEGDFKRIYLRSKAVELFIWFVHAADSGATAPGTVKSAADRGKLYFVKEYLVRNYADPLSLTGMAKLAGLNEFKLKTGFRELFHTSVIDFLIHYRLERARELLLDTSKNISEVAYETGYASPAYFSKAFRKKYGVSPKKIMATSTARTLADILTDPTREKR